MHWLVVLGAALNLAFGRHLALYFSIYLATGAVPLYKDALGDNILNSSTLNPTLVPSYCIFSVIVSLCCSYVYAKWIVRFRVRMLNVWAWRHLI
jgi:hypothetical protein